MENYLHYPVEFGMKLILTMLVAFVALLVSFTQVTDCCLLHMTTIFLLWKYIN